MPAQSQANVVNEPEVIIEACERALQWVEDKKLRKQIETHIRRLENR